jgi:F0F1-type ATP synthase alpha subunit
MQQELFSALMQQGPVVALLGLAVWAGYVQINKQAVKIEELNNKLLTYLHEDKRELMEIIEKHASEFERMNDQLKQVISKM